MLNDITVFPCAFEIAYVRVYEDLTPEKDLPVDDLEAAGEPAKSAGVGDGPSAEDIGPA